MLVIHLAEYRKESKIKYKEGKFKDDNEFPISNDLLFYIVNNIVTKEYPLINKTDGEEIGIQKEQDKQN